MACAHPLKIKPQFSVKGRFYSYDRDIYVPCGYCVNCRRDQQNFIIDKAEYEYKKRLTASFVTFTYDDIHLIDRCALREPSGGFIYDDDKVRTSLNYKDLTDFLHSIREYVKFHPELHGVLCQPDFSYLYCGEYGDCFGRCHFHVLFFGLDFAFCKKIIFERWRYGFIDVLPLLDGGIRYVTKYMDKFEKGDLAFYKYDIKGIARPKLRTSVGFGSDLLFDNVEDIVDNFYTYKKGNVRRPISAYWKSILTGNCSSRDVTKLNWRDQHPVYKAIREKSVIHSMMTYNLKDFSSSAQRKFSLEKARIREQNIIQQLHNRQIPTYDDFSQVVKSRFGFITYDNKRIRKLPTAMQRLLVEEYRQFIEFKWLEDKFA